MKNRKIQHRIDLFVKKSLTMHPQYDYSKVSDTYTTVGAPCTVICLDHGDFDVIPQHHSKGFNKCPKCTTRVTRLSCIDTTEVIVRFNKIHNNTYDYSRVEYVSMHQKIAIVCPTHGEFHQTPSDHIYRKAKCPVCAGNLILTYEEVVHRATQIHGSKYKYHPTNFGSHITVVCKEHGQFTPLVSNLIHCNSGCNQCANENHPGGYMFSHLLHDNSDTPCTLYVVLCKSSTEEFYKIGITTRPVRTRLANIPYEFEIVYTREGSLFDMFSVEQHMLRTLDTYHPSIHFSGHTECVKHIDINLIDDPQHGVVVNYTILPDRLVQGYSFMRNLVNRHPSHHFFFEHDELDAITNFVATPNIVIGARLCKVVDVDTLTEQTFLSKYHLQRYNHSKICYGLEYNDELVQIMSFGKSRYTKKYDWELIRLCTKNDYSVVGGSERLFKQFIRQMNPHNVVSYCDRRYSSGQVYKKLGFVQSHITTPKYYYKKNGSVFNRLKFQKHKLIDVLDVFDPLLSEKHNMINNGYSRIYDAGQIVFDYNKRGLSPP